MGQIEMSLLRVSDHDVFFLPPVTFLILYSAIASD